MEWIRTGRKIGKAVKNVGRLRQIVTVFAKHGFADILTRMNLGRFLPVNRSAAPSDRQERSIEERLRSAFEELGPTFVKLGQILSTRPDLLPEHYIEEFTKLQDNVLPVPFEVIRNIVEKELGKPLGELFTTFGELPLASASIAQVHQATLPSGEKVVVKVQRPEISKIVRTDISLLEFLASLLEKYVPETQILQPSVFVSEFFRTLTFELDFKVEAMNMSKMSENLREMPNIVIPRLYRNLSTHSVLTMERLEGIRVNDIKSLDQAGINRKKIVELGAKAFFKNVMIDGLFHGDLHGGNLFVLPGDRLGVIDFGVVGRLSERSRDQLANMMMSLVTEDYENLSYQYAELGSVSASVDFEGFQREVRNTLSPYIGLNLAEVNAGAILIEATRIAAKYKIKVPGDWMIVFKAILTLEGLGRTLDPEFDLLAMGQELIKDLVQNQYSLQRIGKDAMWIAKDLGMLVQALPRQIRWMFRKFNANDFAFEIKSKELDGIRRQMDLNGRRSSLTQLTIGFYLACCFSLPFTGGTHIGDYPAISVLFFGAGTFFLLRLILRSFR